MEGELGLSSLLRGEIGSSKVRGRTEQQPLEWEGSQEDGGLGQWVSENTYSVHSQQEGRGEEDFGNSRG